jgi:ABC-type sugar transport system ATPase subunit
MSRSPSRRQPALRLGQAVDHVDLTVEEGEFFTLLGPSGCGKTTLLRMIAGFCELDSGEIRFGERRIDRLPAHCRDIGMVFQNYAVFPNLTVAGNVAYGLKARRVSRMRRPSVDEALALVQLTGYGERKPHELSGGQLQRVAIARALVIRPQVLLFDEPLSNLDARLRVSMRAEIRALQKSLGITAIYVTHDQEEAMSVSDRIALMNAGRLEQVGPAGRHLSPSRVALSQPSSWARPISSRPRRSGWPRRFGCRCDPSAALRRGGAGRWQRLTATVAQLEMLGPLTRLDLTLANGTPIRMATLDARTLS